MFWSFDHLQVEMHNTEIIDDLLLYIVKSCHCWYWLNLNMYDVCRYALLLEYYNLESIECCVYNIVYSAWFSKYKSLRCFWFSVYCIYCLVSPSAGSVRCWVLIGLELHAMLLKVTIRVAPNQTKCSSCFADVLSCTD
jgi:hypothetical protein